MTKLQYAFQGEKEGVTPQEPEGATVAVVTRLISEAHQTPTHHSTNISKIERTLKLDDSSVNSGN